MSTGFDRLAEKRDLVLKAMLAAGYARQQLHDCLGEQAFPEDVYTKLRDDSDKMWSYDLKFDGRTLDQWTRSKPSKASPQRRGLFALGGALLGLAGAGVGGAVYNKFKKKETPPAEAIKVVDSEGGNAGGSLQVNQEYIEALNTANLTLRDYNTYNATFVDQQVANLQGELQASKRQLQEQERSELARSKLETDARTQEIIAELSERNQALQRQIADFEAAITLSRQSTESLETRATVAEAHAQTLEQDNRRLTEIKHDIEISIASMHGAQEANAARIKELERDVNAARLASTALEENVKARLAENATLQEEKSALHIQLAQEKGVQASAQVRQENLQKNLDVAEARAVAAEKATHDLQSKQNALQAMSSADHVANASLVERERSETLRANAAVARAEAAAARNAELQGIIQVSAAAKSDVDALLAAKSALLEGKTEENARVNRELGQVQVRVTELEGELREIRAKHASVELRLASTAATLQTEQLKSAALDRNLETESNNAKKAAVEAGKIRAERDKFKGQIETAMALKAQESATVDERVKRANSMATKAGERAATAESLVLTRDQDLLTLKQAKNGVDTKLQECEGELNTARKQNETDAENIRLMNEKIKRYEAEIMGVQPLCARLHAFGTSAAQQPQPTNEPWTLLGMLARPFTGLKPAAVPKTHGDVKTGCSTQSSLEILNNLFRSESTLKSTLRNLEAQMDRIQREVKPILDEIDISTVDHDTGVKSEQVLTPVGVRNNDAATWVNATLRHFQTKMQARNSSLALREIVVKRQLNDATSEIARLKAFQETLEQQYAQETKEKAELSSKNSALELKQIHSDASTSRLRADLDAEKQQLRDEISRHKETRSSQAQQNQELAIVNAKLAAQTALAQERTPEQKRQYDAQPADLKELGQAASKIVYSYLQFISNYVQFILNYASTSGLDTAGNWEPEGRNTIWFKETTRNMTEYGTRLQFQTDPESVTTALKRTLDILGEFVPIVEDSNRVIINHTTQSISAITECDIELRQVRGTIEQCESELQAMQGENQRLYAMGYNIESQLGAARLDNLSKLKPSVQENDPTWKRKYELLSANAQDDKRRAQDTQEQLSTQFQAHIGELNRQIANCYRPTEFQIVDQFVGQFFTTRSGLAGMEHDRANSKQLDEWLYNLIISNAGQIQPENILEYFVDSHRDENGVDYTFSRVAEVYEYYVNNSEGISFKRNISFRPDLESMRQRNQNARRIFAQTIRKY
jgi:hypothetical protein